MMNHLAGLLTKILQRMLQRLQAKSEQSEGRARLSVTEHGDVYPLQVRSGLGATSNLFSSGARSLGMPFVILQLS